MDDKLFAQLLESAKEMVAIEKGEKLPNPERVFVGGDKSKSEQKG